MLLLQGTIQHAGEARVLEPPETEVAWPAPVAERLEKESNLRPAWDMRSVDLQRGF
jgi:hypothetical protein